MLNFHMSHQIAFNSACEYTKLTFKWILSHVLEDMTFKRHYVIRAVGALVTYIFTLDEIWSRHARANSTMLNQLMKIDSSKIITMQAIVRGSMRNEIWKSSMIIEMSVYWLMHTYHMSLVVRALGPENNMWNVTCKNSKYKHYKLIRKLNTQKNTEYFLTNTTKLN